MYLLHQLLTENASRHPERCAVRLMNRSLTYRELEQGSNRLCAALAASGVRKGDRIGILLNKSLESIVSIYGILKAGAIYVPLDPAAPAARIGAILGHCGIAAAISTKEQLERLSRESADLFGLRLAILAGPAGAPTPLPGGTVRLCWDDLNREGAAAVQPAACSSASPAYILHTSGSTGAPKGVVISHLNALTFVEMATAYFALSPDDVIANHAPLHFDLSIFDIFCAAKSAATVVLVPESLSAFPVRLAEFMRDQGITVWNSVASLLTKLADQGALERFTLPALRLVHFSGDLMPVKYLRLLRRCMPGAEFYNIYGQTEANSSICFRVPETLDEGGGKIPIGKPFPNFEVFALDDAGNVVAEPGREGELHVLGATVALGYWNDLPRTQAQFTPDPRNPATHARVYRTGDLVRLDEQGNYLFSGRKDHMVKSKGFRVELDEIEIVLNSHPGISQAAVVAIPDELTGSRIVAYVSLSDGAEIEPRELIGLCGHRLPKYMVPEQIQYRPTLPLTSNGKIDRKTLIREFIDPRLA